MIAANLDRYVIGREHNIVRVNFTRSPEPPTRPFPGAGAMRACAWLASRVNATATGNRAEVA
ncbi:hypothetical protein [Pseudorhodoplanes sp.]|uniref:hypothetical protein n=1 Tax=Pseudorhodoplanes sp. TaxID=1934341 RepID=UPI00391CA600